MCTLEKRGNVFILTLTGPDEHRLNPTLTDSIFTSLNRIRSDPSSASSALITTGTGKFFSNGYDLAWARTGGSESEFMDRARLMDSKLRSLVKELMSLPMPTIAAVNGHASAAGMVLALSHDYVYMRKDRGFLYMSELDINLPVPAWFVAMLRCKVGSPQARRDVALAAKKLTADMAVKIGIVDAAHDNAEQTVDATVRLGEQLIKRRWDGRIYAQIRTTLYAEALNAAQFDDETVEDRNEITKSGSRL